MCTNRGFRYYAQMRIVCMVPIFQVLSTVLLRAVGRQILIAKDNVCLTQEEPDVRDVTGYIHVSVIAGRMKFPNQNTFMNI